MTLSAEQITLIKRDVPQERLREFITATGDTLHSVEYTYLVDQMNAIFGHLQWAVAFPPLRDTPFGPHQDCVLTVHGLPGPIRDGHYVRLSGDTDSETDEVQSAKAIAFKRAVRWLGPAFGLSVYRPESDESLHREPQGGNGRQPDASLSAPSVSDEPVNVTPLHAPAEQQAMSLGQGSPVPDSAAAAGTASAPADESGPLIGAMFQKCRAAMELSVSKDTALAGELMKRIAAKAEVARPNQMSLAALRKVNAMSPAVMLGTFWPDQVVPEEDRQQA